MLLGLALQGYLVHKKTPTPSSSTMGPYAEACCRVLRGRRFLMRAVPLYMYRRTLGRGVFICAGTGLPPS
jgi:hypothetical protein